MKKRAWVSVLVGVGVLVASSREAGAQSWSCSNGTGECTEVCDLGTGAYGCYTITNTSTSSPAGLQANTENGWGLQGFDTGTGIGVLGSGASGVYGLTPYNATYTAPPANAAVVGYNTSSGYGGYFDSSSGTAVYATSGGRFGLNAVISGTSSLDAAVNATSGAGSSYAGYFNGTVNVEGCFQVNGTNEFGCTSDERLKTNIVPLKGSLDRLLQLRPVTYDWRNPGEQGNGGGKQTGFIAQEVEKIFPQWVGQNRDGFKTLTVPPMEVTAMTVGGFRVLRDRADKADARADKAEAKATALEARLNALEANHPQNVVNNLGLGMFGLAFAGVFVGVRRKKDEKSS